MTTQNDSKIDTKQGQLISNRRGEIILTLLLFLCFPVAHFLKLSETGGRMFWPLMIETYLLAIPVYYYEIYVRKDGSVPRGLWEYMFSKNVWFHPSALQDYALIVINWVLIWAVFAYIAIPIEKVSDITLSFMHMVNLGVEGSSPNSPTMPVIIFYSFVSFVIADFGYYVAHWLLHRVPFLWEFHKVHHSAKVMTPATLHRAHPVDVWLSVIFRILGTGIAAGIFYAYYPHDIAMLTIFGVNIFIFLSYIPGSNLRHSQIWLPFGPTLEHIFLSPAQHHIHHSNQVKHFDKNLGSFFSIWDWMFGTLYVLHGKEKLEFGIGKKDEDELNTVWRLYYIPFRNAFRILKLKWDKKFGQRV